MKNASKRTCLEAFGLSDGADDRNRTGDLLVTSELLYQLSYIGGSTSKALAVEFINLFPRRPISPCEFTRAAVAVGTAHQWLASIAGSMSHLRNIGWKQLLALQADARSPSRVHEAAIGLSLTIAAERLKRPQEAGAVPPIPVEVNECWAD